MPPWPKRSVSLLATVPEESSLLVDVGSATMSPAHERFTVIDPSQYRKAPYGRPSSFLRIALYASLAWNVVLALALVGYYYREPPQHHHGLSRYAKVPHHREAWSFGTLYGSRALEDEQKADQLWESHNASGVVALHNRRAHRWHLPQSRAFPWDTDFSLYTLSGMHSMNCLKKLRRSISMSHRGQTQMDAYADLLQCADVLRQDIICHADDTPMYTSRQHSELEMGEGQTRMCRDWSELERWYEENSACFSGEGGFTDELDQYRNCPPRSRFASGLGEFFSQPDGH